MTKEPIMIDDVDVSECEFFSSGLGYCTIGLLANDGTHICECEQNCHYKQLKRKEQECEELKKEQAEIKKYLGISHKTILERLEELTEFRDRDGEEIFQLKEQYDQLKAESKDINEKLKEKLSEYTLKSSFTIAFQDNLLNKYKQTLAEIKKIAEEAAEQSGVFKKYFKRNNYSWKQHQLRALTCKFNIILQKISEVGNKSVSGCEERWVNNG